MRAVVLSYSLLVVGAAAATRPIECRDTAFTSIYDSANLTQCNALLSYTVLDPTYVSPDIVCGNADCRAVYRALRDLNIPVECRIVPARFLYRDVLVYLAQSTLCSSNDTAPFPDLTGYDYESDEPTPPTTTNPGTASSRHSTIWIIVAVVTGLLGFVGGAVWRWKSSHKRAPADGFALTVESEPTTQTSSASSTGAVFWHNDEMLAHQMRAEDIEDIRLLGSRDSCLVYLVRLHQRRLLMSKRLVQKQLTPLRLRAFVSEICLAAQLDHPCIVAFVGAAWTKETDLQALFEYMPNGDLCTHLTNTQQHDESETWDPTKLQIAIDIADALVYVHSFSPPLVHRDLKSRNILLSEDMRAKLTDFGVSRYQSDAHTMTTGVGTSRWLAPEVINGGGGYDERCDVYSFGMVLSELDSHRLPFAGLLTASGMPIPEMAILQRVSEGKLRPTFRASCPSSLCALALECLSFGPEERPSAVQISFRLRTIVKEW